MINFRRIQRELINGLNLTNFFLVPPIIKFPRVLSKNGLTNSFLSILIVSTVCSSIANVLLQKVSIFTERRNYSACIAELMHNEKVVVKLSILIFHLTATIFSCDLCIKLLMSLNHENSISVIRLKSILCFSVLAIFYLKVNFNQLISKDKVNLITFYFVIMLLVLLIITKPSKATLSSRSNSGNSKFFSSFPLTFLCFAQQMNICPFLMDQSIVSIFLAGLFSCVCYVLLGFLGHLVVAYPEINFYQSVDYGVIRILGSTVVLYSALSILKDQIKNVSQDFCKIFPISTLGEYEPAINFGTTIFFTFLSDRLVKKKITLAVALVESCIVINILPAIMYFRINLTSTITRIAAATNFVIGCTFIILAVFDIHGKVI